MADSFKHGNVNSYFISIFWQLSNHLSLALARSLKAFVLNLYQLGTKIDSRTRRLGMVRLVTLHCNLLTLLLRYY